VSVRKRTWTNHKGPDGEAWIATYTDHDGKRRIRSFEKKQEAVAFHASVSTELRSGIHVPDSQSVTVAEAGKLWLTHCEAIGLERSTLDYYSQHLTRHIIPLIGAVKLSRLTVPMVRGFEDKLREDRSPAMVRKVRISLGALLSDAQERGLVGQNVVHARTRSRRSKDARAAARQQHKIQAGIDYPVPPEVRTLIAALGTDNRNGARAVMMTAIFTGLRISELRGLRWEDVDLKRAELHVRQRADRYDAIGMTKTGTSQRTVPLPPTLVSLLRAWKLACPHSKLGLVFPAADGETYSYVNITRHALVPAMLAAGLTVPALHKDGTPKLDPNGRPLREAKYGWHALRHFYASWCINRHEDGGLELPAKLVQARMGHASITVTMDVYGHLFPSGDDGAELAAAEKALIVVG